MSTDQLSKSPVVFLGPTLDQWSAAALAAADFRPPAAMGDVTRAAASDASCIVIIDGVFESGPSIWHKEILYALSRGIPVIGASSMGALRAAELHSCGMYGFGQVFEQFASSELTDDDEVAVCHGPAETGWIQLSDAMVDIRATSDRAIAEGVIGDIEGGDIVRHAKAEHFKKRSMQTSVAEVSARFHSMREVDAICSWFSAQFLSPKRMDCRLLLENLPEHVTAAKRHQHAAPRFVPTRYLYQLELFGYSHERESHA